MINENTLRVLNDIGFGADIDALESYIMDYKKAYNISDLTKYRFNFTKLYNILKEVKPMSRVLKSSIQDDLSFDDFDSIFKRLGNKRCPTVYGNVDEPNLTDVTNNIFIIHNLIDLVAVNNVEGIDLMITYINGRLYRIYAITESSKQFNFTKELSDKVPNYIEEFSDKQLVEIRGIATIFKNSELHSNVVVDTMHYLRIGILLNKIQIIVNDIFIDEEEVTFDKYWDKLKFLREIGFNVPHHCLLRNIDKENFKQALMELDDYFNEDIEKEGEIVYYTRGFKVKCDSDYDIADWLICYDTKNTDSEQKFESTVKKVITQEDKMYIQIMDIECNRRLSLNKICLHDIYDLEKYNIYEGSRIKFRVIEGKAILTN